MTIIISPITQQAQITINAETFGGSTPSGINETLIELKYSYPNFNQNDLSNFVKGDLVVFKTDVSSNKNIYSALVEKANTGNELHANKNLMVFISYSNSTLILMHKGYLDFNNLNGPLTGWEIGKTIYPNGSNINILPSSGLGHWVKSIGFCVPNSENTNRIWFESDSTYLILQ